MIIYTRGGIGLLLASGGTTRKDFVIATYTMQISVEEEAIWIERTGPEEMLKHYCLTYLYARGDINTFSSFGMECSKVLAAANSTNNLVLAAYLNLYLLAMKLFFSNQIFNLITGSSSLPTGYPRPPPLILERDGMVILGDTPGPGVGKGEGKSSTCRARNSAPIGGNTRVYSNPGGRDPVPFLSMLSCIKQRARVWETK